MFNGLAIEHYNGAFSVFKGFTGLTLNIITEDVTLAGTYTVVMSTTYKDINYAVTFTVKIICAIFRIEPPKIKKQTYYIGSK